MPYIKKQDRLKFDSILSAFKKLETSKLTAGDFNYLVSSLAKIYIDGKGEKYQVYNDLLGALEGIKLELYRRFTAPYEDLKIEENGDI